MGRLHLILPASKDRQKYVKNSFDCYSNYSNCVFPWWCASLKMVWTAVPFKLPPLLAQHALRIMCTFLMLGCHGHLHSVPRVQQAHRSLRKPWVPIGNHRNRCEHLFVTTGIEGTTAQWGTCRASGLQGGAWHAPYASKPWYHAQVPREYKSTTDIISIHLRPVYNIMTHAPGAPSNMIL